ncbi:MAG: hypothetical protein OER56_11280 [Hyphomicrobiales bacterium]|nr:hypothetical protein [Hyphomicrobiales bacterium]
MNKQLVMPSMVFVMLVTGIAAASAAQQTGRYILKQTSDGFLRLDTETGAVAHCLKRDSRWQCDSLKAGGAGQDPDIARLKKQNEELKKRVARLEETVRSMTRQAGKPKTKLELPSDEELDEMMGFLEKLVSRFMQFARTLQDPPGEDI